MENFNPSNPNKNPDYIENVYNRLLSIYNTTDSAQVLMEIGTVFRSIPDYKDSQKLAMVCFAKARELEKAAIYKRAMEYYEKGDILSLNMAISEFYKIPGYGNSSEMVGECRKLIKEIRQKKHDDFIRRRMLEGKEKKAFSDTSRMVFAGAILLAALLSLSLLWYQIF